MTQGKEQGFTLIEAIFSITIFSIIVLSVFQAYRSLYLSTSASEQKLSALEMASGQIELARSLAYEDIGTVGGVPEGVFEPVETVVKNGHSYSLTTTVADITGNKLVEVSVSCSECRNFPELRLVASFAP